ncbi:MAG: tetratricopeptide repeat protein [Bacteroidales bacterium]
MQEHNHNIEDDHELKELIARFEASLSNGSVLFFDVDEFEDIIDYYMDFGLTQKARMALHHAFRIYPGSSRLNIKRAQILAYQNKRERALDILSEMEVNEPENTDINLTKAHIYSQMQLYDKSIQEYIKAAESDDQDLEDIFISIAFEYENKGDFDNAIEYLHRALQINPDNESVIFELSYCHELNNTPEAAIPLFNQYLDRNPYSALAWFNLGVTYSQMERWQESIDAYDYVIAIDEKFASAYFNKANALGGLGLYEKAIETYLETFKHEEPDGITWYYIGECYEKLERFKEAIDHYLKAVSMNESHIDAWIGIGSCYQMMGNYPLAVQYLNIAIEKDVDHAEAWYMLGDVSTETGDLARALDCYQMVVTLDPQREDIWVDLCDCHLGLENPSDAQAALEDGLTRFPGNAPMLYRQVVALFRSGMIKESMDVLQRVFAEHPTEAASMFAIAPELRDHSDVIRILSA